eukprot:COSAG02_NODE_80_length_40128_cov_591.169002_5_plen_131_part_00
MPSVLRKNALNDSSDEVVRSLPLDFLVYSQYWQGGQNESIPTPKPVRFDTFLAKNTVYGGDCGSLSVELVACLAGMSMWEEAQATESESRTMEWLNDARHSATAETQPLASHTVSSLSSTVCHLVCVGSG